MPFAPSRLLFLSAVGGSAFFSHNKIRSHGIPFLVSTYVTPPVAVYVVDGLSYALGLSLICTH